MHKTCGNLLKKNKVRGVGKYDKYNCHGGTMWGLPKECNMTNRLARDVMFKCIQSGKLTFHQLRAVRKSFSYSKELKGGESGDNWEGIKVAWDTLEEKDLPNKRRNLIPLRIPTVHMLKKAFTTKYDAKYSLPEFCTGTIAAYEKSENHQVSQQEGWQTTAFKGGRAKLGKGKYRDWSVWRICLCKGKKHKSPPEDQLKDLDKEQRPLKELEWEPTCPLAALEFTQSYMNAEEKCYPKWLQKSNRMAKGNYNVSDIAKCANEWMRLQDAWVNGTGYDHNSGRKSLARWLDHLGISYRWGFEIHGDLEDVWRSNYQPGLPKSGYKRRNQSRDPDEATRALRCLAKWFGRGCERKIKRSLNTNAMLTYQLLKKLGEGKLADKIIMGVPVDSDDEEYMNKKEEESEEEDEEIVANMKEEDEEEM